MQQVYPLSDGSGLRITCAVYELPNGQRIAEQGGIVPDIEIPAGSLPGWAVAMEQDMDLQKALAWIEQSQTQ